jgi:pyrroloquinoline quinone biosynthesis protein D
MNEISGTSRPALAAGVRLQADRTSGEPVLLYPEGLLFLNETAHEVVRRLNGTATVDGILAALAEEYETDPATLRRDVLDCLENLRRQRLMVMNP